MVADAVEVGQGTSVTVASEGPFLDRSELRGKDDARLGSKGGLVQAIKRARLSEERLYDKHPARPSGAGNDQVVADQTVVGAKIGPE